MCDQCGKRFKLKWALNVHRRSHSAIRPYVCNICEKAFANGKDLLRHELIHSGTVEFILFFSMYSIVEAYDFCGSIESLQTLLCYH